MASNSFSAGPPSITFYAYAERVSQDIPGNYTRVRMTLKAVYTGSGGWLGWGINHHGSINGVAAGSRWLGTGNLSTGQLYSTVTGYVNVAHNADGTRDSIRFAQSLTSDDSDFHQKGVSSVYDDFPRIPRGPRVRNGNVYKQTVAYVKSGGSWKIAIPYVKHSGSWKIGGG